MSSHSSDEEELEMTHMHKSVNFGAKNNTLSLEEDKKGYRKRSSSLSLKFPKNFVPKLKPIKANICPSPINLDPKAPDSPEKFSLEQNEINLKPIKLNHYKNKNNKNNEIKNENSININNDINNEIKKEYDNNDNNINNKLERDKINSVIVNEKKEPQNDNLENVIITGIQKEGFNIDNSSMKGSLTSTNSNNININGEINKKKIKIMFDTTIQSC